MPELIEQEQIIKFQDKDPDIEQFGYREDRNPDDFVFSFPARTGEIALSEDEADAIMIINRADEPSRPLEDVLSDLGLDE